MCHYKNENMEPMLNLKRDRSTDVTQCIICQEKKSDKLLCATEQGLTKLKESVQIRQKHRDCQNRIAIDRLVLILTTNPDSLVWHKSCYASFTSKTNITRLQNRNYSESCEAGTSSSAGDLPSRTSSRLRSSIQPGGDWEACMFRQDGSTKAKLSSVTTLKMSQQNLDPENEFYLEPTYEFYLRDSEISERLYCPCIIVSPQMSGDTLV